MQCIVLGALVHLDPIPPRWVEPPAIRCEPRAREVQQIRVLAQEGADDKVRMALARLEGSEHGA